MCPPCAAPPTRRSVGPFPPRGFPPLPWYYRPIRLPALPLPLRSPLGSAPAAPAHGEGGTSRVPYASRPCVPTAEAPVDAGPLWPGRAAATAFPAVAYGSASTVKGISGLVPFMPACGGFRPTGFLSTLRPDGHPARRKTRSQRPGGLPDRRWDFLCTAWRVGHPLGSADLARRTQRPRYSRPPKAHLATLPDPSGMGIPLDLRFGLLVLSLAVSRMWAVPLLTRPLAAVRSRVPRGRAHPLALRLVSKITI